MLGIVCGLESEAVLARKIAHARVVCAAAQPLKARRLTQELVAQGVTRLMSFGIAGGLEPDLAVGSVVIGTHVYSEKGQWLCDEHWMQDLVEKFPEARIGGVWGSEFLVAQAHEKKKLYEQYHCRIVDMESQCMAQIASEAQLPISVLRVVCDTSVMNVPPFVMEAIAENGQIDFKRAIGSLFRKPSQIPALIHVGRGTRHALQVLETCSASIKTV